MSLPEQMFVEIMEFPLPLLPKNIPTYNTQHYPRGH